MKHIPNDRSVYHRWGYHPHDDAVYLNNDNDHDQNGYAYRIDGGWRLTDKDHDSVNDPYLIKKIISALNGNNGEESITPNDYNFEKLHYGQPLPRER
jgi:hypothetical protein